ncbi:transcriptional regulator, IclR family [Desulfacinum hydrothermale DSM 13146]|uniref:Transcriptional regulator, IclR family n=1 Tax=Desulfacinum hydrothermale DSM 13146 TaxID=1121390 RepID=A0A1W1X7K8_9BACT|nr:IclR family transcriptional regulator [Desulfacinum hydrothermale]SMC19698.1 transcriptional regulator, IclR family [Desulfacinum hydrothermale DSM 13146]
MSEQRDRPNAIEKALQLLLAFQTQRASWGVRELAAHLGFSPATVQRLLKSLKAYHFVEQDAETRQYRLGHVYYRFLEVLQSQYPVTREAAPIMRRLSYETGETVHLNVIDGRERLCIDSVESPQALKAGMPIGNRSPLYAGASSKCLLAFCPDAFVEAYLAEEELKPLTPNTARSVGLLRAELKSIRAKGFAESLAERTLGLGSLSVPVFGHGGNAVAALSLAIPELRYGDPVHKARCLALLQEAGRELSQRVGHTGPYPPG